MNTSNKRRSLLTALLAGSASFLARKSSAGVISLVESFPAKSPQSVRSGSAFPTTIAQPCPYYDRLLVVTLEEQPAGNTLGEMLWLLDKGKLPIREFEGGWWNFDFAIVDERFLNSDLGTYSLNRYGNNCGSMHTNILLVLSDPLGEITITDEEMEAFLCDQLILATRFGAAVTAADIKLRVVLIRNPVSRARHFVDRCLMQIANEAYLEGPPITIECRTAFERSETEADREMAGFLWEKVKPICERVAVPRVLKQ